MPDTDFNPALEEFHRRRINGGWQPIETAPRDGTDIIAWWSGSKIAAVIYWLNGRWLDSSGDEISAPTHWMPLPAPPAT